MRSNNGFGIEIVVNGRTLPEYQYMGKTYVAAPWDQDFQLRFIVPSYGGRYEAVASVDGLDICTGKDAGPDASGYVLSWNTDNTIPGFRLNMNEVARFHFGDRQDSYAAQLGKPRNVGVIGVIFYSEFQEILETTRGGTTRGGGATRGGGTLGGPTAKGATRGGHDMGTEFGHRDTHRVQSTHFRREHELARLQLEYASHDSLISAGVIQTGSVLGNVDAFPADTGCRPPHNWKG